MDFYIIFDKKFLILGQYYVNETSTHGVGFHPPFMITDTESPRMIQNYAMQFDNYFRTLEVERVDFGKITKAYSEHRFADEELVAVLETHGELLQESEILDFGCGTGNYISALEKKGYRNITGVDKAEGMRKIARNNTGKATSNNPLILLKKKKIQ